MADHAHTSISSVSAIASNKGGDVGQYRIARYKRASAPPRSSLVADRLTVLTFEEAVKPNLPAALEGVMARGNDAARAGDDRWRAARF